MGCIVNGPGEMADADYGYVGAGLGRVTLYKGKEAVEVNIPEEQALEALKALPLANGRTTSFYETAGSRQGYVKGSYKVRERWLMSWWAFDWRVGEDKVFSPDRSDGINFYTSLKPWARDASDMRDFASFLQYWGWKL